MVNIEFLPRGTARVAKSRLWPGPKFYWPQKKDSSYYPGHFCNSYDAFYYSKIASFIIILVIYLHLLVASYMFRIVWGIFFLGVPPVHTRHAKITTLNKGWMNICIRIHPWFFHPNQTVKMCRSQLKNDGVEFHNSSKNSRKIHCLAGH